MADYNEHDVQAFSETPYYHMIQGVLKQMSVIFTNQLRKREATHEQDTYHKGCLDVTEDLQDNLIELMQDINEQE